MGTNVRDVTQQVEKYVGYMTSVFLAACGMLVVLYAVYVGWRMAKAQDEKQREEAKSHLIYSIIGVVAIAIVAAMLKFIIPMLKGGPTTVGDPINIGPGVNLALYAISDVVNAILDLLATAAVIFAVYIGWQLIKADEEKKRQNAKMQLIYTIIAVVGVVLINTIAQAILNNI